MATIAKQYTFSGATVISSSQVNANFDTLYNTLAGTNTTTQLSITSSNGNTPLKLNQQSAGYSQEWQDVGVTKLRVLKAGVLESLVTTGTAPFTVTSTTKVENLNADTLDGIEATGFAQIATGRLTIPHATPSLLLDDTDGTAFSLQTQPVGGVEAFVVEDDDASAVLLSVDKNGLTESTGNVSTQAAAPTVAKHLTRKDYVDGKLVPIAICGFFPGGASTSHPRPSFIVPSLVENLYVRKIRATYQGGTNTGTTTLQWVLNGVGQETVTFTTQAADSLVSVNIDPDVALSIDDIIYFKITAAGNHADITVVLHGDMTVV